MLPTTLIILKETQKKDRRIYLADESKNIYLLAIHSLCVFANNTKLPS